MEKLVNKFLDKYHKVKGCNITLSNNTTSTALRNMFGFGSEESNKYFCLWCVSRAGVKHSITYRGTTRWYNDNKRHRDGGLPAVIHSDGLKEWWVNNNKVYKKSDNS